MKKMNPVVHFEMPYKDQKRLSKFYSEIFGWEMQFLPDMGSYVLAMTTPVDKNRMPTTKGAINGGFYPQGNYGNMPHLIISVDNIEDHIDLIKKSGGIIADKPSDIKDIGKFVMFTDTEGNRVGLLQPKMDK